jgi:hypothetical protein
MVLQQRSEEGGGGRGKSLLKTGEEINVRTKIYL